MKENNKTITDMMNKKNTYESPLSVQVMLCTNTKVLTISNGAPEANTITAISMTLNSTTFNGWDAN